MKGTTLMDALRAAGYPEEDFFHHYSDLYVFATPLTARVIDEWFMANNLEKNLFVSTFKDQITGRPMFDITFQYYERK